MVLNGLIKLKKMFQGVGSTDSKRSNISDDEEVDETFAEFFCEYKFRSLKFHQNKNMR